ncbi:MAG: carbohydrate kinase family protein [Anaerolineae bacterium]|nr:carbohydrate kinase family protein [Anaerolineae bacterium]
MYDVLVVGDYCLDFIFAGLPAFPRLGVEVVASAFAMTPGGAYNAVAAMHRLGLRVGWAADFGGDDFSRFILEQARAEGLDPALFVHHERPLRLITVAASYPEDRAFLAYYDPGPAVPAALKSLAQVAARAVYVAGLFCGPLFDAGRLLVRAKGMKLLMDGNSHEDICLADAAVRRAIGSVDLFLCNAREARRLTAEEDLDRAMEVLVGLVPLLVVKDGAGGAYACRGGQVLHEPALAVTPRDTTGAGDCFNAGFIAAWLEGRPLEECLQWGNVVGGLSTEGMGGTGRPVSRTEVEERLKGSE